MISYYKLLDIVDKETRKTLLQMKTLTLKLSVNTCQAYEASASQLEVFPNKVTAHMFRTYAKTL